MSSSFYKSQNPFYVKPAIRFVVKALQEKLAEYVQGKMVAQNLSTHDVARRSGGLITHATVWNVANARVRDVKPNTLRALAKGLGVSEDEIFDVARGKANNANLSDLRISFFGGGQDLTQEDWDEVMAVAQSLIQQKSRRKKR